MKRTNERINLNEYVSQNLCSASTWDVASSTVTLQLSAEVHFPKQRGVCQARKFSESKTQAKISKFFLSDLPMKFPDKVGGGGKILGPSPNKIKIWGDICISHGISQMEGGLAWKVSKSQTQAQKLEKKLSNLHQTWNFPNRVAAIHVTYNQPFFMFFLEQVEARSFKFSGKTDPQVDQKKFTW